MWSGEQKGMRRHGPRSGTPNAADPATVLQRGFPIRSAGCDGDGSRGATGFRRRQDGKATGVAARSAGVGRLFLYESSALSCCRKPWEGEENPTVLSKTTTCEPGDLPSTGMVPTLGSFPVASTEVVVATFCIRGSVRPRRCRSVLADRASIDSSRMPVACAVAVLRAVGGPRTL